MSVGGLDDDSVDFTDYVPTAIDPGYFLIWMTLIFCICLWLLLPVLVILGGRYETYRLKQWEENEALRLKIEEEKAAWEAAYNGGQPQQPLPLNPSKKVKFGTIKQLFGGSQQEVFKNTAGDGNSSASNEISNGSSNSTNPISNLSFANNPAAQIPPPPPRNVLPNDIHVEMTTPSRRSNTNNGMSPFSTTSSIQNSPAQILASGPDDDHSLVSGGGGMFGRMNNSSPKAFGKNYQRGGGSVMGGSVLRNRDRVDDARSEMSGTVKTVETYQKKERVMNVVDRFVIPSYPSAPKSAISGAGRSHGYGPRSITGASSVYSEAKSAHSAASHASSIRSHASGTSNVSSIFNASVGRASGGHRRARARIRNYNARISNPGEEMGQGTGLHGGQSVRYHFAEDEENATVRSGVSVSSFGSASRMSSVKRRQRRQQIRQHTLSKLSPGGASVRSDTSQSRKSYRKSNLNGTPSTVHSGSNSVASSSVQLVKKKKGDRRKKKEHKQSADGAIEISPGDAADANDPGKVEVEDEEDNFEYSICCGENALWKCGTISHGINNLIYLAELDNESQRIIRLSVPFTAGYVIEGIYDIIELALISNFLGFESVAAYALVDMLIGTTDEFLRGIIDALATLTSHAVGSGNNYLAGQYVQIAGLVYFCGSFPLMFVWMYTVEPILLWFGMDEATASIGKSFVVYEVVSIAIDSLGECVEGLLEVTDHESFCVIKDIVFGFLNVMFIAMTLVMMPECELWVVAVIHIIFAFLSVVFMVGFATKQGWLRPFTGGMLKSIAFKNGPAVKNMINTALPLSIGQLLAYGEWEVLTIFASHMGPAEVATWAILGSLWETFEATTEGMGDASEIRVAYHLGKNRPDIARLSSYKSLLFGMLLGVTLTSLFFICGDDLPKWFTTDPTIQKMITDLIPLVGFGNITMTFGMVCWALIGAQGRYQMSTKVILVTSWCVTQPLAAILTYVYGFNLQGLAASVVIGYSIAGTVLSYILIRSDWPRLSHLVQEMNKETGEIASSDEESASSSSSSSKSSSSSDDSSDSSDSSDDDSSSDSDNDTDEDSKLVSKKKKVGKRTLS